MTKVPEGYTELELVGFTDKGNYTEGTNYVKNDLVHYKGSIYRCTEDDTLDVTPNDTSCWEVFIPGQSSLESISAVDTEGKLGTKGEEVSAQRLMDAFAKEDTLSADDREKLNTLGTPDGKSIIVEENGTMKVPIDNEVSAESENPLQNKIITQKITEINQSIEELNTLLNGIDETLGGKLDVSKIANNLVTTEEGYTLDARMGKALVEKVNGAKDISYNPASFTDANNIPTTRFGVYTAYNPNNSPIKDSWVSILNIPMAEYTDVKYTHQIAFVLGYSAYYRQIINGDPTDWKTFIFK